MMDIRPTSEAAHNYIWFGRNCLDLARRTGLPGARAIQDGRWLVICRYTLDHATLITLSRGDFALHPRSGTIARLPFYDNAMNLYTLTGINGGGYAQVDGAFGELSTRYGYPLVDNDRGTFLVMSDGDAMTVEWAGTDSENYGNIWWQGPGDNPPVLSWKGPPSVQYSVSGAYNLPGLSQVERTVGETPYYTVFGCYIYRDGAYLCHGPQWFADNELATLVVGACYATDANDTVWLVAITVTRKGTGFFLQAWRSDDAGATWGLLSEFPATGRARVPAFINATGQAFVYDGVRYEIDATVSSVARTDAQMPAAPAGTRTIDGTGGYESNFEFHGSGYCWPGMDADGNLAYSSFTADARFISTGNGATAPVTTTVPVYRGSPATSVTLVVSSDTPICGTSETHLTFEAIPNGSYCSVSWNGVDCVDGLRAAKILPECGSGWSVSVTLQPQGITATYTQEEEATPIVTVSGPDAPSAGSQYGVSGGTGPYTFSITKGSIDPDTGIITSVAGACGVATVTATDFCGKTGSMDVRMPNGSWSPTWWVTNPPVNKWGYDSEWAGEAVGGSRAYFLMFKALSSGGGTYEDVLADMQAQAAEQSLTFDRLDWNEPPAISVAYGYLTKSQSWEC